MLILDGRKVSEELFKKIKIDTVKKKICIILIGNNEDSIVYVNMKKKKCLKYNIETEILYIEKIDYNELIQIIKDKNIDENIDGIMVQLPLPNYLKQYSQIILDTILYTKDIDGLTSTSIGKLAMNYNPKFKCCTPYGIVKLLNYYNIEIIGKNITIIGYSNIVGKPLSLMLSNMGGTVSVCTIETKNISDTFNAYGICDGKIDDPNKKSIHALFKEIHILSQKIEELKQKLHNSTDFQNNIKNENNKSKQGRQK